MKNNLPYFSHETDARNHPKLRAIRARYDYAGVGRFWTLNEIIAGSENCRLDLSRKIYKSNLADELKMTPADLEEFLLFLADPEECGIIFYENNEIWNDHTQEDFSRTMNVRERAKEAYQKKKGKIDDSTDSLRNNSVETGDFTSKTTQEERRGEEIRLKEEEEEEGKGREKTASPPPPVGKIKSSEVEEKITSLSLVLDIGDYLQIADHLNRLGLPLEFLDFVLAEVKSRRPNNFLTFFRKAVYWPDFVQRYKINRPDTADKKAQPPKICPTCGRMTIYTADRAMCKPCGLYWDYDQKNNSWELDQAVGTSKLAAG